MQMRLMVLFLFFAIKLYGQKAANELFDSASKDRFSFNQAVLNDSILNFHSPKGYIQSMFYNLGRQATFPLRMQSRQFITLGSAAVITFALFRVDKDFERWAKPIKSNHSFINDIDPQFTDLGDYYGYMILAGYCGYSVAFHKYRAFRTALLASQAAISAGIWIRVGKLLTGRMRPGATYNDPQYKEGHWFGPFSQFNKKYNSYRGVAAFDAFPSGHTGAAFAIATVFAEEYKDQKAIPVIVYSLASLIGVSRLIEHDHWASDVFVGGLTGYLCAKEIVANDKRLFPDYKIAHGRTTSTFFFANQDGVNGIGWKMRF